MKTRLIKLLIATIAILMVLFFSCEPYGNSENNRLMRQAILLAEQIPDSALTLLDAVNMALFSDAERADYTLLRVQARYNADRNLTTDTEIFRVYEYFAKKNDAENAALAGFYSACVAKAQNNPTLEMDYYLKTIPFVEKTDNLLLKGKIYFNLGYLDYGGDLYAEAIANYRQALKYFQFTDNQHRRQITTLKSMANTFLVEQHTDSAQFYYQSALDLAQLNNDTAMMVRVYNHRSVSSRDLGQLDTAIHYYRYALRWASSDCEKAHIYKKFAFLFFQKEIVDSVRHYLSMAEPLFRQLNNHYALANLTHLCYQIEKACGNHSKALEYFERYHHHTREIDNAHDRKALLDLQKKYDAVAMENEYNREKRRLWKITGIIGCLILSLTVCVFYTKREEIPCAVIL